jgi:hypothetical protein
VRGRPESLRRRTGPSRAPQGGPQRCGIAIRVRDSRGPSSRRTAARPSRSGLSSRRLEHGTGFEARFCAAAPTTSRKRESARRMRRHRLQGMSCSYSPSLCIPGFRKRGRCRQAPRGEISALSFRGRRVSCLRGVTQTTRAKCLSRQSGDWFRVASRSAGAGPYRLDTAHQM